ncbi:aminotransferase class I/II-fold pyridoxal phosphate-dependent enzyme [Nakamurella silvestris]|nr:aminotransferase class I/II-fold pyridoxal phosphate-dependent enzyme [Nakamurella silvestris]
MTEAQADGLDQLRTRTSVKWRTYPDDVLPLWVAEMDYRLAAPVAEAMIRRITESDLGYVSSPAELGAAFAGFVHRTWGWEVDPGGVRMCSDVSVAIVETFRRLIRPGDRIAITPPVYTPFFELTEEAGGQVHEVPLLDDGTSWSLDLDGLEAAFASGTTVFLLCNPHNPVGLVHSADTLRRLADLAAAYDVTVVSDEIHGPLVYPGVTFTPFLSVSEAAREHGICVTSASKAWNLAGAKCALMVAQSARALAHLDAMPAEVGARTSQLGLHASIAAFEQGGPWLSTVHQALTTTVELLGTLLAQELPEVVFRPPSASYLAWLDFRALGWGDDPAARILDRARVALVPGHIFGDPGRGHARLNFACSPEVLSQAIRQIRAC